MGKNNLLLCLYRMDVPIGKTVYTCMLNKRAGVEADLTVSMLGTEEVSRYMQIGVNLLTYRKLGCCIGLWGYLNIEA